MKLEYKNLCLGLLGGILIGFVVGNFPPKKQDDIKDIIKSSGARVGVIVTKSGEVKVAFPDGAQIPPCDDPKRKNPCFATFSKDSDGNPIVVNAQTGERLKQIFPVKTIIYGAYEGSLCPIIGNPPIDVCSYF